MNRLIAVPILAVGLIAAAMLAAQLWARSDKMPAGQVSDSGGAPMVDVRLPVVLSADALLGKAAFDANCADCHGQNAAGRHGVGPPLVHKIYEPNHHGDMAFQLAAKTGVRAHHWSFGSMPPVENISDFDVAYVTLYIRMLQRENGIN